MAMSFGGVSKAKVATVIVAADGSGDTTDIQTGINMLPAGGGVVYVKEGTYVLTVALNLSSNMSLIGAGTSTVINHALAEGGFHTFSSNIIIDSLKVEVTAANCHDIKLSGDSHIKLMNCEFNGGGFNGAGVFLANCSNITISNNYFVNGIGAGIAIENANGNIITGNIIDNINTGIKYWINNNDNIISNNIIYPIIDGILIGSWMVCSSNRNLIIGNKIIGGNRGIYLLDAEVEKTLITGNIITGSATEAITDNGTNTLLGTNILA